MQDSVKLDRHKYIGGSDIPVIMGISPFKRRFELLQEKAQIKTDNFEGNKYTEYGNDMEDKIRKAVNKMYGMKFVEGKHTEEGDIIGYRCHTDGETDKTILEVKTTSEIHDNGNDYKIYLVQMLFYMIKTNKHLGILAVYERPEDLSTRFNSKRLHTYQIKLDDYAELVKEIEESVSRFVSDLKKLKDNPFLEETDLFPTDMVELCDRIIVIENQLKRFKEIEAEAEKQKQKLMDAMREFGIKSWKTPNGVTITVVEGVPSTTEIKRVFNEEVFKIENESLWEEYTEYKEVTKKGRKGYLKTTFPKEEK